MCRARNPLGIKNLMAVLWMPGGPCRQPLGKMTSKGLDVVLTAARTVWQNNPEILAPVALHFSVDIDKRLNDKTVIKDLAYESY